ncbi:GGDEF domain-containing protein [Azotobacter beijerinckii]|uniref:diguanylate cyclase n=1 Tax=Azotobacter beijerinckii TaxID=170623 RepID=A0A1I4GCE0_9GAMM|nr:GGDEF domain-containing protein [Azotobacter beijerinckii]SFB56341.1 diguanylate cyclase (GGDEF) domain-containing protein [Azotobacter beijerinckii]SFL27728.1 diguanylate cyclase (GGDEF) domain-containing protein [Azotobacter beijerinckii]
MNTSTTRLEPQALQRLLLNRFAMALGTYAMAVLLLMLAIATGYGQVPLAVPLLGGVLLVLSQLVFFLLLRSERNLRLRDPGMIEAQVLVALFWQTGLLGCLNGEARGTLLAFYAPILLFGLFQLPARAFARCAAFGFVGFVGLELWDAYRLQAVAPELPLLQLATLFAVLFWLCLFGRYINAMRQRMHQRRHALVAHQNTLRGMMRQLEDQASTDELTGLCNRRHFLRLAERELTRLPAQGQYGLALIDLDHFKRINDRYGHAAGDRVLQTFATLAQACLREGDVLARYGGEEFVLLLPGVNLDQISICCERLREAFSTAEPLGLSLGGLSLSIGMTRLQRGDNLDLALQRADQALYRAKHNGRNRCEASWEPTDARTGRRSASS